ncbi:MAG: hypothetical protein M3140_00015 [Actinomycetota bacterium]|nr:hypothetical protein [Actinomycetota bacterium]
MAELSRAQVLAVMRRTGHFDKLSEAALILPDRVDTERDAQLLTRLGLSKGALMNDMGDSP